MFTFNLSIYLLGFLRHAVLPTVSVPPLSFGTAGGIQKIDSLKTNWNHMDKAIGNWDWGVVSDVGGMCYFFLLTYFLKP